MKKQKFKMILHLAVSIAISFLMIYLFVFIGGWKLIESGDPILTEIAVSLLTGFVLWIVYEIYLHLTARIDTLEKRLAEITDKENNRDEK